VIAVFLTLFATNNFTTNNRYVRRIAVGEKQLDATIMDDVLTSLNSDDANDLGETLLMQGERMLDGYENLAKKTMFKGAMAAVANAGLTEESVMNNFKNLDVNTIVQTSEKAISSEAERVPSERTKRASCSNTRRGGRGLSNTP